MSTVRELILRYRDDYGWGWAIAGHLINRQLGTAYTVLDLKHIYKGRGDGKPASPQENVQP